jgi:hypothetical protein
VEGDGMFAVQVSNEQGHLVTLHVNTLPDQCPICHQGIKGIDPGWKHIAKGGVRLEMCFICPRDSCNHVFLGRYVRSERSGFFDLRRWLPAEPQDSVQPDEIQTISPTFCSIFNEAQKAEALGLLLISGPGYRKSLEFLIKDYLTSLQSEEASKKEIADKPLMAVIKKYITDKRMLQTAERATWLGNDETHYVRKWEDKDLQDMKKLMRLTIFWIQSEHLTNEAVASMPEGKK